jgi:hypothetical protein
VLELKGGESASGRSEVRIRRSFPGDVVLVLEGRRREEPGMRPAERDWDCVKRPSLWSGEVMVAAVSVWSEDSVAAVAMIIVGEMEREAAARVALGPATLLMATEACVKRAARVQASV